MRLSLKTRGALRARSWPATYQRPRRLYDAPRLQCPLRHLGAAVRPVVEGDRAAVADRLPQRSERGLLRGQPRLDAGRRGGAQVGPAGVAVGLPARRPQLQRRARGRACQLGRLPDPGRDAEHGRLVRLQVNLWQLVVLAADPVAEIVIELGGAARFQRDAQVAQLLLVALEHALEGLLLLRVTADRGADLLRGQVPARGEQENDDRQEAFGPALRQRDLHSHLPGAATPAPPGHVRWKGKSIGHASFTRVTAWRAPACR